MRTGGLVQQHGLMPHVWMFRLVARKLWKWGQARDRELDPGHWRLRAATRHHDYRMPTRC